MDRDWSNCESNRVAVVVGFVYLSSFCSRLAAAEA